MKLCFYGDLFMRNGYLRLTSLLLGNVFVNLRHDIFVAIDVQKLEKMPHELHDAILIEKSNDLHASQSLNLAVAFDAVD